MEIDNDIIVLFFTSRSSRHSMINDVPSFVEE